jgi:DNA polymerase-3 subunit epsilon
MSTLFIDSETTGIADFRLPLSHSGHPHVCQWGAILDDDERHVVAEMNLMIKPDGWEIPEEAAKIHGITTKRALRFGVNLLGVMKLLNALIARADKVVAHNMAFDGLMAAVEFHRLNLHEEIERWRDKCRFCTMEAATPILKLPGRYNSYKWPNLQEAHEHFFGVRFDGAHDAMADVRACKAVYYALPKPTPELEEIDL